MSKLATRADIEDIVARVVTTLVTTLVPPIVEKIVDDKIDEFAIMVGRGFADTQAQINEINEKMVTKDDFKTLFRSEIAEFQNNTEQSLYELKTDMGYVKKRLDCVEMRLDGVEGAIGVMTGMWRDHEVRIVHLEGSPA